MLSRRLCNRILAFHAKRPISNSVINIGSTVKSLVTGKGPFIDIPTVTTLGNPGGFLKVLLPQGSVLNAQLTTVSFIKGDPTKILSKLALQFGNMWYQKITLDVPCTLLLSNNESPQSSQSCVTVSKSQKWVISNANYLLAWSGFDLSIVKRSLQLYVEGRGFFITSSRESIQDFYLKDGELVFIQSQALVATCCSIGSGFRIDKILKQDKSSIRRLSSLFTSCSSSLCHLIAAIIPREWRARIERSFSRVSRLLHNVKFLRNNLIVGLTKQNLLLYKRVCGPGQVLVKV